MRLNRLEEAGLWYRESLRSKPDHIPAHLTYGKLLSITVGPVTDTQTHTSTHTTPGRPNTIPAMTAAVSRDVAASR